MLSERTHTHGMPWLYDLIRISEVAECPLLCLNLCSLNLCHFWNAILGLKTTGFVKWASCVVILKKCCICQNIKHLPSQQNYISKHPTLVETTKYCTDSLCKINLHKRWSKNNSNKTFEESPSQNLHTYTLTMNACKQKRSTFCFETPGAKFNQCLHYPTLWIQNLCPKSRHCTHHYSTHLFTSFAASCNPITSSCLLAGVVLQSFLVGLSQHKHQTSGGLSIVLGWICRSKDAVDVQSWQFWRNWSNSDHNASAPASRNPWVTFPRVGLSAVIQARSPMKAVNHITLKVWMI